MLRSRLYIGMAPVVGLLVCVCLYSYYDYTKLNKQLDELQNVHYASITTIDQLLLATSQVERSIRLRASGDRNVASSIMERGVSVMNAWLENSTYTQGDELDTPEAELTLYVQRLKAFANNVIVEDSRRKDLNLATLLEQIEDAALRSITARNHSITRINADFQRRSQLHFKVVTAGIVSSLFMTAAIAYLLSQRILKPIDALTTSAEKLAAEEWVTSYQPTSKDEIGKLERAFVDMSHRIQEYNLATNKKLVRTRRRMEKCFANLPHPVMFINIDRKIVYQNPVAKEIIAELGWKKQLPEQLAQRIESVLGTGEELLPKDFEETISFNLENGSQHFLPILVRIDSENTDHIECALILQDVTNLRLSDDLKSDLVATISHEIKNPVTSANLALLLVLEQNIGPLNEDQSEMISTAAEDLKRLQRLLDHLLQIARLEKTIPKMDTSPQTVSVIIETSVSDHHATASLKGVSLKAEVDASLPKVDVDLKMINIALSNFISNAIKYAGSEGDVRIYAEGTRDGSVRIGVRDSGPGLPESDIPSVFDKFFRSSQTEQVDGVGLGLSICKDIVTAHQGTVGCEKRSGAGMDFHFILPPSKESEPA